MAQPFSGGHGSSTQSNSNGSSSLMITEATVGLVFAWKSTAMSISGPSPSRNICTRRIASGSRNGNASSATISS
jgi:hypothetical protein